MTQTNLSKIEYDLGYHDYLLDIIGGDNGYKNLLMTLHSHAFYWLDSVPDDRNRARTALELREKYKELVGDILDQNGIASVLEVLISLAIKCEDSLMRNFKDEDTTYIWFWSMLENAGLLDQQFNDLNFIVGKTDILIGEILDNILSRNYGPDGYGGFFYAERSPLDFRKLDLWIQLNQWILENYEF